MTQMRVAISDLLKMLEYQWDTNRTNRTRSSWGKYESALFYGQIIATIFFLLQLAVTDVIRLAVIRFCLGPLYLLIYGRVSVRHYV